MIHSINFKMDYSSILVTLVAVFGISCFKSNYVSRMFGNVFKPLTLIFLKDTVKPENTGSIQAFEDYSKDVNLTNKSVKTRGSDVNLMKFIYSSISNGCNYLLGGRMIATEKMDGTQVWFRIDENGISELRTHNGFLIGNDIKYGKANDFHTEGMMYQKINIGAHFHSLYDNYIQLYQYFKSIDPTMTYCYIFMEVMLPESPCNITYPIDLCDRYYIFQINTSSNTTYRVNTSIKNKISTLGLDSVPIVGEYDFTTEGVQKLVKWIKQTNREGVIIELISNDGSKRGSQYFKVKNGAHDTSTFANRFTEDMYLGTPMEGIIKSLIDLANTNVRTQTQDKRQKAMSKVNPVDDSVRTIKILMKKEITHNDWEKQFQRTKRSEYKAFILKFTKEIESKLKIEHPTLLQTEHYKKIVKKNLFIMLQQKYSL